MYIDSHCHLNHNRLLNLGGPTSLVDEANSAGVEGMLTISCRIHEEYDEILKIAQEHRNVWCTVGTHPHVLSKTSTTRSANTYGPVSKPDCHWWCMHAMQMTILSVF